MNRRLALVLVALAASACLSQAKRGALALTPQRSAELDVALAKLHSPDWRIRSAGFYALYRPAEGDAAVASELARLWAESPPRADAIRLGLIQLLERENVASANPPRPPGLWGEDFMNYYGDVIQAVAALRDARAVAALGGAITTGGMATAGLAHLGSASVPTILQLFRTGSKLQRNAALTVMVIMMSNPADRANVRCRSW